MAADVPQWLDEALSGFQPTARPMRRDAGDLPQPGEIVLAAPLDGDVDPTRLVAVVDAHPRTFSVVALLLSNRVDDRTDADFLVEPAETGLPYPVVIQADIVGALFENQLSAALGTVSESVLSSIRRVQAGSSAAEEDGRRGLPIRSQLDPRWEWKESEIDEMQRLAGTCTETLLAAPIIDPAIAAFEDMSHDLVEIACTALISAHQSGEATIPDWVAEIASEHLGAADLPLDVLIALPEMLVDVLAHGTSSGPPSAAPVAVAGRRPRTDADLLGRLAGERLDAGVPLVRVATIAELWEEATIPDSVIVETDNHRGVLETVLIAA